MKKEYKLNLHGNKIIDVLRYIVLIFVFFMIAVLGDGYKIEAATVK